MIYLNVPYSEKNIVKERGAKWDPKEKKWFVKNRKDYSKFLPWLITTDEFEHFDIPILVDYFYIIEGMDLCWKCKQPTKVIGFADGPYFNISIVDGACEHFTREYYMGNQYIEEGLIPSVSEIMQDDDIQVKEGFSIWPNSLLEVLKKLYNYHYGYSHTLKSNCYANHCQHCDALQGNHFLFHEISSPFFLRYPQKAKHLTIYKIPLKIDIANTIFPFVTEFDEYFKLYAHFDEIDGLVIS